MAAHLSYYEVLGLDAPPADRKAVKRAYSKMLKVTRPEDDPDGFMRLRDAHDLALNILTRQAENAAWEAQPITVEATYIQELELDADSKVEPKLTYEDILPAQKPEPDPVSDTSYAIGATPNLDAPAISQAPPVSQVPRLIDDLDNLLQDPKKINDRQEWNVLFREARQLDIDDYVDFEQLLLEKILSFHDYSYDHPQFYAPENMPRRLSPTIAASLFKTMSWDQVNKRGHHRAEQIEWLERRMSLRKRSTNSVPIPEEDSVGTRGIWTFLICLFILIQIILALAKS